MQLDFDSKPSRLPINPIQMARYQLRTCNLDSKIIKEQYISTELSERKSSHLHGEISNRTPEHRMQNNKKVD